MITIPNLFGAYQKGREAAIDANWNDLKNYENIEAMRTRNDRDALQLLADQADYNINRSMMRDNGDVSALNAALAKERFYSDVYNARNNALLGQSQYTAASKAAADGRLQNYANQQLMTTFRNGETNWNNAGVNSFDAAARYDALINNGSDYQQLVNDTVGFNIRNGQNTIKQGDALRGTHNETETYNAKTTRDQAYGASLFNGGKVLDPEAITQSGANTAKSAAINAETGVVDSELLFNEAINFDEKAKDIQAKQLMDQRTKILQNIRLAAQSGDMATVNSMASQFGYVDTEIVKLGLPSQRNLVREAVASALGAPPSTAGTQVPTQVPTTPATQTPPTRVPQQLLPQQPQRVGAGGFTNDDWARIVNNDGVGSTGGYW